MTLRALDLFCGAGGATRGLQQAGFHVTGVDISPQPRYCGDKFIQAGVQIVQLAVNLTSFDLIWASPPCQAHTSMKTMHNAKAHLDLIPETRAMLKASGVPYVMENVAGAPLHDPVCLCGTMFGLGSHGAELRRHRMFEASFDILRPKCCHTDAPVIGVYGGHVRNRRRRVGSASRGVEDFPIAAAHEAMEIDWMTLSELSQAIPPAYSRHIAKEFLSYRKWLAARGLSDRQTAAYTLAEADL